MSSHEGQGTTFTVTIPTGSKHLPQEQLLAEGVATSTAVNTGSFVEEALRWLPDQQAPQEMLETATAAGQVAGHRPHILLADDNADMRDYVRRLLGTEYEVETVSDGIGRA